MIHAIRFTDPAHYSARLPALTAIGGEVRFQPGLNIILGPNGSGKSTITRHLAESLAALEGGRSTITKDWVFGLDWGGLMAEDKRLRRPCEVIHDGKPLVYLDPREAVGLSETMDNVFFNKGVVEASSRTNSSGEATMRRSNDVVGIFFGHEPFPAEVDNRLDSRRINDVWRERLETVQRDLLAANGPEGQPTVIIDEPETGLSLLQQQILWTNLLSVPLLAERFQVILVSHSHAALNVPHANYIELTPGYRKDCIDMISGRLAGAQLQNVLNKHIEAAAKANEE